MLLIVSAVPGVIEHSHGALACFVIAVIVMGLGTGGFKSNISPLVAEQYRKTKLFIKVKSNGERVIVDPTLTWSRIYLVGLTSAMSIFTPQLITLRSTSTCSSMSVLWLVKLR